MRYRLGRFLQLVGLILLPAAMAGNLARPEELSVGFTLKVSAAGIAAFYLGWLLQRGGGGA